MFPTSRSKSTNRSNRSMIPTLIRGEPERCAVVEVKELIRQADDLHELAKREKDPKVRHRLNRMADAYSHMAEIGFGAAPPSHGLMDALTNSDDGSPPSVRRRR